MKEKSKAKVKSKFKLIDKDNSVNFYSKSRSTFLTWFSRTKEAKSPWEEFVLSVVRSRLAVAQVVEEVKGNAKLTFDFVSLIILAG